MFIFLLSPFSLYNQGLHELITLGFVLLYCKKRIINCTSFEKQFLCHSTTKINFYFDFFKLKIQILLKTKKNSKTNSFKMYAT